MLNIPRSRIQSLFWHLTYQLCDLELLGRKMAAEAPYLINIIVITRKEKLGEQIFLIYQTWIHPPPPHELWEYGKQQTWKMKTAWARMHASEGPKPIPFCPLSSLNQTPLPKSSSSPAYAGRRALWLGSRLLKWINPSCCANPTICRPGGVGYIT